MAGFNAIAKSNFLQTLLSLFFVRQPSVFIHNLEKYKAIKKCFEYCHLEEVTGDYIEFGVFGGSSFCHAIRCQKYLSGDAGKFWGFDSFDGFGELSEDDRHPFYTDSAFSVDFEKVSRRVSKTAASAGVNAKLIKGLFSQTLVNEPEFFGVKRAKIIFVDCDTKAASLQCLNFSKKLLMPGTVVILDDFFGYKGRPSLGVCGAFNQWIDEIPFLVRPMFNYGLGGQVYVIVEP